MIHVGVVPRASGVEVKVVNNKNETLGETLLEGNQTAEIALLGNKLAEFRLGESDEVEGMAFLREIDGMIESTGEFIRDDELDPWNDSEGRFMDLACLIHVRDLFRAFHNMED